MLADFGLTAVIDESAAGSVVDNNGIRGTLRWMAPELMYPDGFGFTKECRIRLPSRGTDIYALGMTILEVRSFLPSLSSVEQLGVCPSRLSQDAVHITTLPQKGLLCAKFSKASSQIDHPQVSRIHCGNYWWRLGSQSTDLNPRNARKPPPSAIG